MKPRFHFIICNPIFFYALHDFFIRFREDFLHSRSPEPLWHQGFGNSFCHVFDFFYVFHLFYFFQEISFALILREYIKRALKNQGSVKVKIIKKSIDFEVQ